MRTATLKYLTLLLLSVPAILPGQVDNVRFTREFGRNGITPGKVNAMMRDHEGAMWLSDETNARVIRFDGTLMTSFNYYPDSTNALSGSHPECLMEDTSGNIWIGFYTGGGLTRLNHLTNTYTHYRHDQNDPGSLPSDSITVLLTDHHGQFWIGTYNGLARMDVQTGQCTNYTHDQADPTSLSNNRVRAIYEDRQGTLWIGTGHPWDPDKRGGLNKFDRSTGSFTRYMHDPNDQNSLAENKVRALYEDSRGNFWVGTTGDGLNLMDRESGHFLRLPPDHQIPGMPRRPPLANQVDHVTFITEDAFGYLWIGTLANGISRFDPRTDQTSVFNIYSAYDKGFTDNSGWCASSSEDGLFWVSTQEAGLFKVDLHHNYIPHVSSGEVRHIFEWKPSKLLMAASEGLYELDLSSAERTPRRVFQDLPWGSGEGYIEFILQDREGILWLTSQNGLYRLNPVTRELRLFQNIPGDSTSLGHNSLSVLHEGNDNTLWIGSFGGGLHRMDKSTETFTRVRTPLTSSNLSNPADSNAFWGQVVLTIEDDSHGDLWFGTVEGFLNRLNTATGNFNRYHLDAGIMSIMEDFDQDLWIGTWAELYKYDRANDRLIPYEDLYGIHLNTMSLVKDDNRNFWISSDYGLVRLDSNHRVNLRLGTQNGIVGPSLFYKSVCYTSTGELLYGTQTGYYIFNPDNLKVIPPSINLRFSTFALNGVIVPPGSQPFMSRPISEMGTISLNHDQNTFGIGFSLIDFSDPQDQIVQYRLENHDHSWQPLIAQQRQVTYYNLPPGNYRFSVRARNTNSTEQVERSVGLTIHPPWWKTWWAYGIYGLLFIAAVLTIHRIQRARVLRTERERTKDRELAQAREIEKAYTDLKNTQNQLIHAEKMASLGELTAGIAHEIQNPLNFVNNFAEVNAELIEELKEEISKGNTEEVKELANDISDNEQKVIYHGKRADAIVKSMLQHSRGSNEKAQPTDINALVDECVRLSYHGMRAKDKTFNCEIETHFDEALPLLYVIPQDIGRVVLNLVTNAFHAVSERWKQNSTDYTPLVEVSTVQQNGQVMICVRDNGTGIPQAALDKIFQPFFTTKPSGKGTGLGLSISYEIVAKHDGQLQVDSEEGTGTEFRILLPNNKT